MSEEKPGDKLTGIAKKWLSGKATAQQREEFDEWYNAFDDTHYTVQSNVSEDELQSRIYYRILDKAGISTVVKPGRRLIPMYKLVAAAIVILCVGFVSYIFFPGLGKKPKLAQNGNEVILPGCNKAVLTLGNGKKIVIDSTNSGHLANDSHAAINKTTSGSIVYTDVPEKEVVYNSLTTPRGGLFTVVLPDGTQVTLNAASSLKYPTAFEGNERRVELTGEAYFEVAHNPQKPFRVVSNNQTVEVLGTHFDLNAYPDEAGIKTTLLEGSVKVSAGKLVRVIEPGQQAILVNGLIAVSEANTEEAVAWKNGYFRFNDEKIESIMRKISLWYDVDIQYQGDITTEGYNGTISRYRNIQEVLSTLELTQSVHFKINGRRITVLK
jgi:ferric-dicitrate binding protein FerR (iron transport regulator)